MCGSCRIPVAGKCCIQCGKPAVLASSFSPSQEVRRPPDGAQIPPSAPYRDGAASAKTTGTRRLVNVEPPAAAVPKLRLRNRILSIDLDVANNADVGRTTGPYSSLFGKFDQVSGRHCSFKYDFDKGWCVMDFGSTNKTYYNNIALIPNLAQTISDGGSLKIANIEFFVSIGSG
ncbi:MAG: FHA domain-containing protein [Panacagrimonas sp.]